MKTKKMKIQQQIEIEVPVGTKIIANDDWITLARRKGNIFHVLTCPSEDIHNSHPHDEASYQPIRRRELLAILKI